MSTNASIDRLFQAQKQNPSDQFDVLLSYRSFLSLEDISVPLAAILSLTRLIECSTAGTMFELVQALNLGAETLRRQSPNPISLNAGCELFIAFVTLFPHDSDIFSELKTELVKQGQRYAVEALTYRSIIADLCLAFIKDDSVILTHSYSRVVMKALLRAHERKRISVYVTESRPGGNGLKTFAACAAAGIPCTVVLDSAVAYVIDKVDFVLVGSEAVVESGGLVNYVGSLQMAIIARAANKPFYALVESYKFHRLFPLSQYDLPTHNPNILAFPRGKKETPSAASSSSQMNDAPPATAALPSGTLNMTPEQIAQNPEVDYTRPDLISLVISDIGPLTPEGVSQYLVGMFAG